VLTGGGLAGATLALLVGITSDRFRRKPFLLAYEGLSCACALVALSTTQPFLLAVAIVLAGFGRGANGAAGPFSPAEQAWLAEAVEPPRRGFVYSINTSFGFVGMSLGALAAAAPTFWRGALGQAGSFRPLFFIVLLGNVVNLVLLVGTPEKSKPSRPAQLSSDTRRVIVPSTARTHENGFLLRLIGLNALNGLAIGLTGPLMAYWFAMKFHAGPGAIGPVMAATFAITAVAALVAAPITQRFGLVRSVQWGRSFGLALLLILPLMPAYALASIAYILRSALNRGTIGARQALVVSVVRDHRRGFAVSVNILSQMLPMSIGPVIAGAMIGARWFTAPFYIAAVLQGLYVIFYGRVFRPYEEAALAEDA
jgi:MFS family permease